MDRLFIKLYAQMLTAIIAVVIMAALAFQGINHYRSLTYAEGIISGIFHLIAEGVSRQKEADKPVWLSAISNLIGTPIYIREDGEAHGVTLRKNRDGKLVMNSPLPNSPQQRLEAELTGVTEQQLGIASILILNELGRFPAERQPHVLEQIRAYFSFPIHISTPEQLGLTFRQERKVRSGEIIVALTSTGTASEVNVYAPYGNSGGILHLGPLRVFEPYPLEIAAPVFILSLLLLGGVCYLIFRPVEKRLQRIDTAIRDFHAEKGTKTLTLPIRGNDALDRLCNTLNGMSATVSGMLDAQQEMMRVIAHEFNTPVTRIRFRSEMIDRSRLDAHSLDKLEGIGRDLSALSTLVDEVISFLAADSQPEPVRHSCRLRELVDAIVREHQEAYPHIASKVQCPNSLAFTTNVTLFRRIMDNLVSNAFKYSQQQIKVDVTQSAGQIIIAVENDNFTDETQNPEKLFNPFYREAKTATPGFGLGLSIARHAAQRLNGELHINRPSPSTIKVTFTIHTDNSI